MDPPFFYRALFFYIADIPDTCWNALYYTYYNYHNIDISKVIGKVNNIYDVDHLASPVIF